MIMCDRTAPVSLPFADNEGKQQHFTFSPGKNEIVDEVWSAIRKQHSQKWHHYEKFLREFKSIPSDIELDASEEFQGATLSGRFEDLSIHDCLELIENTNDIKLLEEQLWSEQARGRNRRAVLGPLRQKVKSIDDQNGKMRGVIE